MTERSVPGARVELIGVRKEYADVVAVDDVTLTVEPGEFITFLGPSGSGKTTTLNMIAGFADATRGEIQVDGRDVTALPPHKRHIGMVFQSYALFPNMTVRQNVAFPLQRKRNGVPKADVAERVNTALEMVDLSALAHRRPRELSGGQQQRVALARALVFSPSLLLLDEPLAALDKRLRERLQNEMRAIHKELGVTFVLVTHDQTEAMSLSDRIVVFNHGAVQQVGRPEELYRKPQNLFVAEFLGDSNLFEGTSTAGASFAEGKLGISVPAAPTTLGVGAQGHLLVRPEHLILSPSVSGSGFALNGTIKEAVFEGASYRTVVDVPGVGPLVSQHPATSDYVPVGGAEVAVSWHADAAHVIAADDRSQQRENAEGVSAS